MASTIRDVARQAGVSIATVSRAMREPVDRQRPDPATGSATAAAELDVHALASSAASSPSAGTPPTASSSPTCPVPTTPRSSWATRTSPPSSAARCSSSSTHGRARRPRWSAGWPAAATAWSCSAAPSPTTVLLGARRARRPAGPRGPPARRRRRLRVTPRTGHRPRPGRRTSPPRAPGRRLRRRPRRSPPTSPSGSPGSRPAPARPGIDVQRAAGRRARRGRAAPASADGPRSTAGDLPDAIACANDELALGLMTALRAARRRRPRATSSSPAGTTSWPPATPG